MPKKISAQSATEFIVLASFMLFVIVGFFAITTSNMLRAKEDSNMKVSQDIAEFVNNELEIAKSVNNGYKRNFTLPSTVNGIDYSINITDGRELTVNYIGYEHLIFLSANVTGNISKGSNVLIKINGIIFINPH